MLFLRYDAAVRILAWYDFLEILRMAPGNLNACASLRNISENSVMQSVLINLSLVDSFVLFFIGQVI